MTFDPGADGFREANELFGIAPLMNLDGGTGVVFGFSIPLYKHDLDVYGADGTELGTANTTVNTMNLLGIDATESTVTGSDYADGVEAGPPAGDILAGLDLADLGAAF